MEVLKKMLIFYLFIYIINYKKQRNFSFDLKKRIKILYSKINYFLRELKFIQWIWESFFLS